jgi:hypothetical protein
MCSILQVSKVVSELAGKSLEELIKEGTEKIGSVPSGGGAAAPAAAAAGGNYFTGGKKLLAEIFLCGWIEHLITFFPCDLQLIRYTVL